MLFVLPLGPTLLNRTKERVFHGQKCGITSWSGLPARKYPGRKLRKKKRIRKGVQVKKKSCCMPSFPKQGVERVKELSCVNYSWSSAHQLPRFTKKADKEADALCTTEPSWISAVAADTQEMPWRNPAKGRAQALMFAPSSIPFVFKDLSSYLATASLI